METKQEGNAEKFFSEFGKKLDKFSEELKDAGNRIEKDMRSKFEELKVAAEKLRNDADNKKRWKEVETNLKKAGEDLEKAFKAAFKGNTKK
jgi:phosphoglycerate-specific signal transduction histidine kinase